MSYLAKQILQGKKVSGCDEFGIPLKDRRGDSVALRTQYLVARTFLVEQRNPYYDKDSTMRLHLRNGEIYEHNHLIEENKANFYRLTQVDYQVAEHARILFWAELKRRLPILYPHMYKIAENLWWDKKNGEIMKGGHNEILEKIN